MADTALRTCPFIPLSKYDWTLVLQFAAPRGRCFGITLEFNPTVWCLFAAIHAVTVWVTLGLVFQVFYTFKKRTTLYFWSIMITAAGLILMTLGFDLRMFTTVGGRGIVFQFLIGIGWSAVNLGFSLVLFSRLHLIMDNQIFLRTALLVILGTGLPYGAFVIWTSGGGGHFPPKWAPISAKRFELWFLVQEFILSILYIYLFYARFLKHGATARRMRWSFCLLVLVQLLVVSCDACATALQYTEYYLPRLALQPFFYAVKLKAELFVLNRLATTGSSRNELQDVAISDILESEEPVLLGTESRGPILGTLSLSESGNQTRRSGESSTASDSILETTPQFPIPNIVEDKHDKEKRSFDEMERRYLGRLEMEKIV